MYDINLIPPTHSSITSAAGLHPARPPRVIIFYHKQTTHQVTDNLNIFLKIFLPTLKREDVNVSTQVIIRPHLFNEIRLSAPGKELRKQNSLPPSLI